MKRKPGHVALERALSKLGIASRTKARQWIIEGKVRVNGAVRTNPGFSVFPERAKIEIDGEKVAGAEDRTILLHKPRGYVTTHSDEKGRPTVFSLLGEKTAFSHFIAVGRLDMATTGLLIITNNTRLSAWLTDPKSGVLRTYLVSVRGELTEEKLETLRRGVVDEGELLRPVSVTLRKSSGRESHLVISLSGGKNREIRRLCLASGHEVTKLKRVSFGGLELGHLQPGKFREIFSDELKKAFPGAPERP